MDVGPGCFTKMTRSTDLKAATSGAGKECENISAGSTHLNRSTPVEAGQPGMWVLSLGAGQGCGIDSAGPDEIVYVALGQA